MKKYNSLGLCKQLLILCAISFMASTSAMAGGLPVASNLGPGSCASNLTFSIPPSILYRSKNLILKYYVLPTNMPTTMLCPGKYTVQVSLSWNGYSGQNCSHSNSTYCHFGVWIKGASKTYLTLPNGSNSGYCAYGGDHQWTAIYKDWMGTSINQTFTYDTADGAIYAPEIVAEGGFGGGTITFTKQ